ncbi:hypothetical protein AVEN_183035-1 [Araneus ventricosus]|uniref:Uncharacterized protein n=1 Tax=Araneus ventricosus TaxID=182803 RepID=A0A4Y2F0Y1_ARAVE|nr:hypothetical protein AVEN_183035-1 [Araneus ventricosus]
MQCRFFLNTIGGRVGLVVGPRPWGRRIPGSKPDSAKDLSCVGRLHAKSYVRGQTFSRWRGAEVWRGGCQLRHCPRHLPAAQNYEIGPKIALVLLQNSTLV